MIKTISCNISDFLVKKGANPQQREVYSYSMECLINYLLSDLLLYGTAALFHQLPAVFVWSVSYTMLRVHIGGYHAPTHAACIILGTILGMCGTLINRIWPLSVALPVLLFALILAYIIVFAPVVHKNHPVSAKNKKKSKWKALFVTLLGYLAAIIMYAFGNPLANAVLSGFACALLLALIATLLSYFTPKTPSR